MHKQETYMQYLDTPSNSQYSLPGDQLAWLRSIRLSAQKDFSSLGFPSRKEENWKYTDFSELANQPFTIAPEVQERTSSTEELVSRYRLKNAHTIVFLNGQFSCNLSNLTEIPAGLVILPLEEALATHPDSIRDFLESPSFKMHGLTAFTTAYFRNGSLIKLDESTSIDRPIQILNISTHTNCLSLIRNFIVIGKNSEAEVIETYVGSDHVDYLNSSLTQIKIEDQARLTHQKLQSEGKKGYHFSGTYSNLAPHSKLVQNLASFGGRLVRTEMGVTLDESADCDLNGLFLSNGRRHIDTNTVVNHAAPRSNSRQEYRGIASERSRGVFSGYIYVAKDSQVVDAQMNSRNLLLSEDAEIDTKPQLEIHADNVKCSHGVTVGQLDNESIFYLQSRGIDEAAARNMLTFAFANEMLSRLNNSDLKSQVQRAILESLPEADIRGDWL